MAGVKFNSGFTSEDFHAQVVNDFTLRAPNYDSGEFGRSKHALIERMLSTYPPMTPALDIACGTGYLAGELGRRGIVTTGMDLTPSMVERAKQLHGSKDVSFVVGTAEALPFENDEFGCVYITSALSYFTDIPRALLEAKRVLREGGFLAFQSHSADSYVQGVAFESACKKVLGAESANVFKVPGAVTNSEDDVCRLMTDAGFINVQVFKHSEKKYLNYEEARKRWDGVVSNNAFFSKFNNLERDLREQVLKKTIEEFEKFRNGDVLQEIENYWFVRGYKKT